MPSITSAGARLFGLTPLINAQRVMSDECRDTQLTNLHAPNLILNCTEPITLELGKILCMERSAGVTLLAYVWGGQTARAT